MIPARLTTAELCKLWNLTDARISQLVSGGKIRRGPDGKFDRDECFAYRAWQMKEQQINTLFQSYGNAHGTYTPKVVDVLLGGDLLSDEECLGLEPSKPSTPQAAVAEAVKQTSRLTEIRAKREEMQLDRLRVKHLREDGELVDRKEMYLAGRSAAAEIQSVLGNMAYDIAALFPDPETSSEVRRKVENLVDKAMFALARKFASLAKEEAQDGEF